MVKLTQQAQSVRLTVRLITAAAVLGSCTFGIAGEAGVNKEPLKKEAAWSDSTLDLSKDWGIEILGIRLTAANYMLDFRYRVTDAEKAAPIFKRQNKPVIVDQKSGLKFALTSSPTAGPMRSSNTPQIGRTYFMLFGNPGGYLQSGSKVSIQVGPFRAENLVVQ